MYLLNIQIPSPTPIVQKKSKSKRVNLEAKTKSPGGHAQTNITSKNIKKRGNPT